MKVQLPHKPLGTHGRNTYFKEFSLVFSPSESKTYKLGEFYIVRNSNDCIVSIAELQLIWINEKDDKPYASAKLYFNPREVRDFLKREAENYGEDEVVTATRQVAIECSKFRDWELSASEWGSDNGKVAYCDAPEWVINLYKREGNLKHHDKRFKILSFPQYCRYMTCMKMIKMGIRMSYKSLIARGGLILKSLNTIVLFQRTTFKLDDVEDYSPTTGVRVPNLSGRPRKRKQKIEDEDYAIEDKHDTEVESMETAFRNAKTPRRTAAIMATCALADVAEIMGTNYNVAVSKTAISRDTPNIQAKLRKLTDKKDDAMIKTEKDDVLKVSPFLRELSEFMSNRNTPILKIPTLGHAKLNIEKLFQVVASHGGYGQVTLKKQWRLVYEGLGSHHSPRVTNAATCTRKAYEKLLLPYEKYHRKKRLEAKKPKENKEIANLGSSSENKVVNGIVTKKKRGRPRKYPLLQEENNSSENNKLETKSSINHATKAPVWVKKLNADIENTCKRRKLSEENKNVDLPKYRPKPLSLSELIKPRSSDLKTSESSTTSITVTNFSSSFGIISTPSTFKNVQIVKPRYEAGDPIKSYFINDTVAPRHVPNLIRVPEQDNELNLKICSVQSLAKDIPVNKPQPKHYVYYPASPSLESSAKKVYDVKPASIVKQRVSGPRIKETPILSNLEVNHFKTNSNDNKLKIVTSLDSNGLVNHRNSTSPQKGVITGKLRNLFTNENANKRIDSTIFNSSNKIIPHGIRHSSPHKLNSGPKVMYGNNYIRHIPAGHNSLDLVPAKLIPINELRPGGISSDRLRVRHLPEASTVNNRPSERVRVLNPYGETYNKRPSYTDTVGPRQVVVIDKDRSYSSNKEIPPSKEHFTKYDNRGNILISRAERTSGDKYIIHNPARPKEHIYPVVYTHVPQYVEYKKIDRGNIIVEDGRKTQLVYPKSYAPIEASRIEPKTLHKIKEPDVIVVPRSGR